MRGINKIRFCEICGKKLSRYNPEKICFHHQPGMAILDWFPVTSCTSFRGTDRVGPELRPGDPGYNELAFTQSIIGAVNIDGDVVDLNF